MNLRKASSVFVFTPFAAPFAGAAAAGVTQGQIARVAALTAVDAIPVAEPATLLLLGLGLAILGWSLHHKRRK
jgi:hypothetical protein